MTENPAIYRMPTRSARSRTPTKAEREYQERVAQLPCLVCLARGLTDMDRKGQRYHSTVHHRTTGDLHGQVCLGHMAVINLCWYHHQGENFDSRLGPGLVARKRDFMDWLQERFGERSTAALQRWQDELLTINGERDHEQ